MESKIRNKSRSKTPWDDNSDVELTPTEVYLKKKYKEHHGAHHPILSETDESDHLNSIPVKKCHVCGSENIVKSGKKNKLIRYKCKDCNHTFVITTNTIFDSHKLSIEEWMEFCLNLFGYGSTTLISKNNKNSITTSNYWLNKIFLLLRDYQDDIVLRGTVFIDEKYYKKRSNTIVKDEYGYELAGLSRNQDCIFTGCDELGTVYAKRNGSGKPSQARCWDALGTHIARGSTLIHDQERAHNILVQRLGLTSIEYNAKMLTGLDDKENLLAPINDVHNQIEKFPDAHAGLNRAHLQDYLNLFVYIKNTPGEPLEKVDKLIEMGLTKPILLRYRSLYAKKTPEV